MQSEASALNEFSGDPPKNQRFYAWASAESAMRSTEVGVAAARATNVH
jgi:hypothetical protein